MSARLHAARTAVLEAKDTRAEAALDAMLALHRDQNATGEIDRLFVCFRRAHADVERAEAVLSMARAAATPGSVVALPSERAS